MLYNIYQFKCSLFGIQVIANVYLNFVNQVEASEKMQNIFWSGGQGMRRSVHGVGNVRNENKK